MTLVILASSSPRRTELLEAAGVGHAVVIPPPDDAMPADMAPELAVRLIAESKAAAVAIAAAPGACVVGADTMVVGPNGPLGKPGTADRASRMLRELRGRRHTVLTAVCVIGPRGKFSAVSRSEVTMRSAADADIDAYVATGEPLDKAGAYAIQGRGEALIEAVIGRIDTVIGLDVQATCELIATSDGGFLPRPMADRQFRGAPAGR